MSQNVWMLRYMPRYSAPLVVPGKTKDVVEQGGGKSRCGATIQFNCFGVFESRHGLWHYDPLESH